MFIFFKIEYNRNVSRILIVLAEIIKDCGPIINLLRGQSMIFPPFLNEN